MSLATCCVRCVPCIIWNCVACIRLKTALNAGCQRREDVERAKCTSNNMRVQRRDSVWSRPTGRISTDRPWDNYRLCIVVERMACWPIMYVASVLARLPPFRSVNKHSPGQFAPWLFRSLANLFPGTFAPGLFTPWNFCSQEWKF